MIEGLVGYAWAVALGVGLATAAIRLAPEAWLRGRPPPTALARALPWVPVLVAGSLAGVLHLGAPSDVRAQYLLAAVPAAATLLWKRTFYLPLVVGVLSLAILRAAARLA